MEAGRSCYSAGSVVLTKVWQVGVALVHLSGSAEGVGVAVVEARSAAAVEVGSSLGFADRG